MLILFFIVKMSAQRPGTQLSRPHSRSFSRSSSRASTPMVNAESAEWKLKDIVFRNWKEIQHNCRNLDTHNVGSITVSEFIGEYNPFMLL